MISVGRDRSHPSGGLLRVGDGEGFPLGAGEGTGRWLTPPRIFPGPQALVAELHRRALVEYVRPLFRGRLRCGSVRTRSRVTGRLREDAAQLQRLFRRLVSVAGGAGGGSETAENLGFRESPDSKSRSGGLELDPRPTLQPIVTL